MHDIWAPKRLSSELTQSFFGQELQKTLKSISDTAMHTPDIFQIKPGNTPKFQIFQRNVNPNWKFPQLPKIILYISQRENCKIKVLFPKTSWVIDIPKDKAMEIFQTHLNRYLKIFMGCFRGDWFGMVSYQLQSFDCLKMAQIVGFVRMSNLVAF